MMNRVKKKVQLIRECDSNPRENLSDEDYKLFEMSPLCHKGFDGTINEFGNCSSAATQEDGEWMDPDFSAWNAESELNLESRHERGSPLMDEQPVDPDDYMNVTEVAEFNKTEMVFDDNVIVENFSADNESIDHHHTVSQETTVERSSLLDLGNFYADEDNLGEIIPIRRHQSNHTIKSVARVIQPVTYNSQKMMIQLKILMKPTVHSF